MAGREEQGGVRGDASQGFTNADAAIAIANDPHWWAVATPDDVARLGDIADQETPKGDAVRAALDAGTQERYGVPSLDFSNGAIPDVTRDRLSAGIPAPSPDALTAAEAVTVQGVRDATSRLADFGLNAEFLAYSATRLELSQDARVALGGEGAAATLRVVDQLANERLSDAVLIRMTYDLAAHPWDEGPMRDYARETVDSWLSEADKITWSSPERLEEVLETHVDAERRGIDTVVTRMSWDNDREALKGRVEASQQLDTSAASNPTRSAIAASQPTSALAAVRGNSAAETTRRPGAAVQGRSARER